MCPPMASSTYIVGYRIEHNYVRRYIFGDKSPWKYIWVLVVLGSNIIAGFFIFTAATDFTRRSVPVTTIYT